MKATKVNKISRTIKSVSLFSLFLIFSSCLSVEKRPYYPDQKFTKTKAQNIEICFSEPKRKHVLIGQLSIRFNSGYKRKTVLGYLKNAAAEEGADGIILHPVERSDDSWRISNNNVDTSSSLTVKNYEMKAVMFRYLSE